MKDKAFVYAIVLGCISVGMYFLLWLFEKPIIHYSQQGKWFFLIPLVIAFAFSLVHGAFTGYFWDALGIKAKTKK